MHGRRDLNGSLGGEVPGADRMPELGEVDGVPGREGTAPVEDHGLHGHGRKLYRRGSRPALRKSLVAVSCRSRDALAAPRRAAALDAGRPPGIRASFLPCGCSDVSPSRATWTQLRTTATRQAMRAVTTTGTTTLMPSTWTPDVQSRAWRLARRRSPPPRGQRQGMR